MHACMLPGVRLWGMPAAVLYKDGTNMAGILQYVGKGQWRWRVGAGKDVDREEREERERESDWGKPEQWDKERRGGGRQTGRLQARLDPSLRP